MITKKTTVSKLSQKQNPATTSWITSRKQVLLDKVDNSITTSQKQNITIFIPKIDITKN